MSANVTHKHIWIFENSSSCCYGWQVWWQRWRLWWRWRRWRWRLWWRWRCYIWFLVCNRIFWICIATLVFDISCPWTLFLFSNIITNNILICLKKSTSFSEICWDSGTAWCFRLGRWNGGDGCGWPRHWSNRGPGRLQHPRFAGDLEGLLAICDNKWVETSCSYFFFLLSQ